MCVCFTAGEERLHLPEHLPSQKSEKKFKKIILNYSLVTACPVGTFVVSVYFLNN